MVLVALQGFVLNCYLCMNLIGVSSLTGLFKLV